MAADSDKTTSGGGYRIESLRGRENYALWKIQMEDILVDMDLWDYVHGDKTKPAADDALLPAWTKNDRKALTQIRTRITDAVVTYVMSAKTSKEAWDAIAAMFQAEGPMAIVLARRKLWSFRFEDGTDMEEQMRTIRGHHEQLILLDAGLSDKDFALVLLTALPETWDNFISVLDTADLKTTSLVGRILAEHNRRQSRLGADCETTLFAKKPGRSKFRPGVNCYNCEKEGHIAAECRAPKRNQGGGRAHHTRDQYEFNVFEDEQALVAQSDAWLADSATQSHIVKDRSLFIDYQETPGQYLSGAGKCAALGRGTVRINFTVNSESIPVMLKNAIHAPDIPSNLISMGRLTDAGMEFRGKGDRCTVVDGGRVIACGTKIARLYYLDVEIPGATSAYVTKKGLSWQDWHNMMGHLNIGQLRDLAKNSTGMDVDDSSATDFSCEACIQAKHSRRPFPQEASTEIGEIGELTHFDIWGPARTESLRRNKYYISFTDGKSRNSIVYFLYSRAAALDRFKRYKALIETQYGKTLKRVRCDNAKEFVDGAFRTFLEQEGIVLENTAPYSPAQNGVAERLNRVLVEHARAMLIQHDLPKTLWEDAVAYACYLKNRSPTRALGGKTPFEAFTGRKPDLSTIREFGTEIWVLKPDNQQSKLEAKSDKFIFVGPAEGGHAWRYYNPKTRQVQTSRNVIFPRSAPSPPTPEIPVPRLEGELGSSTASKPSSSEETSIPPIPAAVPDAPPISADTSSAGHPLPPDDGDNLPIASRRTSRNATPATINYREAAGYKVTKPVASPKTDNEHTNHVQVYHAIDTEPRTVEEALSDENRSLWKPPMDAEIAQMQRLGTFELVELPPGRKAIDCLWVYALKRDVANAIRGHKARLVAKGCSQIPGQDFVETYSPVARQESLRASIAVAALLRMHAHQMDVVAAFLHGVLDEEIYMRQPPGYDDGSGRVWRLRKAIYGLKQAGRVWNIKLNQDFSALHFRQLSADSCVFTRNVDGHLVIIINHVDDMTVLCSDLDVMSRIKKEIASRLEVKDLGEIRKYLGMEINCDRDTGLYSIHQVHYINDILERFGMANSNPVHAPLDPKVHLSATPLDVQPDTSFPYSAAVGALMYAAVGTRPDIAFAVQHLAQFTSRPSPEHITAVKRIFRYLNGTRNLGLVYQSDGSNALVGHTDADWGMDLDTRRSTSGYVFTLAGGAISWSSKRQRSVALSSMEAEYMALAHATKEALWLRSLFADLGLITDGPIQLYADNESALAFAHDSQFHARSKHIDIRYHFVRERIISNEISVTHCASEDNAADILTKPLARPEHTRQLARIGLRTR